MPEHDIKYGIFKAEIKNRFLCMVEVDGTDTVCYIPSSCRLSNFMDLTEREVMLTPIKTKGARTKYSLYAVKHKKEFVLINLAKANRVVEDQIRRRLFSFLGKRTDVKRERIIDGYKSDLYIENTDTIVEIKSILSFDKEAVFPTVYSERAIHQLMNIRNLLMDGHRICYVYVSLYPGVKKVCVTRVYFCWNAGSSIFNSTGR